MLLRRFDHFRQIKPETLRGRFNDTASKHERIHARHLSRIAGKDTALKNLMIDVFQNLTEQITIVATNYGVAEIHVGGINHQDLQGAVNRSCAFLLENAQHSYSLRMVQARRIGSTDHLPFLFI